MANWRRVLANKILEVQLPYMFKDFADEAVRPLSINVKFGLDKEPKTLDDAHGFCMSVGELFGVGFYEIVLARNLSREQIIRLLSHELVHVMQEERGDEFDYSLPYYEQPHEVEAYGLENELVTHFEGSVK